MKQVIDKFFRDFYSILKEYAQKFLNRINKKYIEVDMLLSDTYCYLIKYNWNKIPTNNDLEGLSKVYIKNNIRWSKSSITVQSNIKETVQIDEVYIYSNYDIDTDVIYKLIDEFYTELTREEKNIWNIYYNKNINTAKAISNHLNISISYSYTILKTAKELEDKLREYVKNNI